MGEEGDRKDPFKDMLAGLSPNQAAADQSSGSERTPNYDRWLNKVPYWTLNELMLLIIGIEPRGYIWKDARHAWPDEAKKIDIEYRDIIETRVYSSGTNFPLTPTAASLLIFEEEMSITEAFFDAIEKHLQPLIDRNKSDGEQQAETLAPSTESKGHLSLIHI